MIMAATNSTVKRKIVTIDESKCNGCGICIPACVEGALKIVDGKAKLVSEIYCDGLGACLGECPQGAITIEERDAPAFDEKAVEQYKTIAQRHEEPAIHGCPGSAIRQFNRTSMNVVSDDSSPRESQLAHWPVQLTLVPPTAAFLKNADIILAADCVPFAYADFHRDFIKDHALLIACPKLDNFNAHLEKLTAILKAAQPKSLTVVHMEVPCCSGLVHMASRALQLSNSTTSLHEITIGVNGAVLV